MSILFDYPLVMFLFCLLALYLAGRAGLWFRSKRVLDESTREDFSVLLTATLTLLGLVIGFSFSMATSRYDQRKNLEEEEANAIGTEYLRAELLPPADAEHIKSLLTSYLDHRITFYKSRNRGQLIPWNADTSELEAQLWSAVRTPVNAQPTAAAALAAGGMNDVLNSQGYVLAAWRNRIPLAAWLFMAWISLFANALVGYGTQSDRPRRHFHVLLPLVASGAFLFIADLDSPRGGLIHVQPQNLVALSRSIQASSTPTIAPSKR